MLESWHINVAVISKADADDKQPMSKQSFETDQFFTWEITYLTGF